MLIILASVFSFVVPLVFKIAFPFLKWLTILAVVSSVLNLVMNRPSVTAATTYTTSSTDDESKESSESDGPNESKKGAEEEGFTASYPPPLISRREGKKIRKQRKSGSKGEGGGATIAHRLMRYFTHGYRPKRSAKQVKRDKLAEERYLKELRSVYDSLHPAYSVY